MPSSRAVQVKSPEKGVPQTRYCEQLFLEPGMSLAISSAALGLHLEFHVVPSARAASCSVLHLACTNRAACGRLEAPTPC